MAIGNPKKSLGQQFADIMMPRTKEKKFKQKVREIGHQISEGAKERTRRGRTIRGGEWKRGYSKSYSEKTGKTAPVNLRLSGRSMNSMRGGARTSTRAEVTATETNKQGDNILRLHDEGIGDNPRRQIFPDTHAQVPTRMRTLIKMKVKEVLSGVQRQQDN